jgi:hypothetical protein
VSEKTVFAGSSMPSCMKCKFFDTITDMKSGQTRQICRLKPPAISAMPGMVRPGEVQWMQGTFWPQVAASDWCGQFTPGLYS